MLFQPQFSNTWPSVICLYAVDSQRQFWHLIQGRYNRLPFYEVQTLSNRWTDIVILKVKADWKYQIVQFKKMELIMSIEPNPYSLIFWKEQIVHGLIESSVKFNFSIFSKNVKLIFKYLLSYSSVQVVKIYFHDWRKNYRKDLKEECEVSFFRCSICFSCFFFYLLSNLKLALSLHPTHSPLGTE